MYEILIKAICKTAVKAPEKADLHVLMELYQSTYQGIRDNIIALRDQV